MKKIVLFVAVPGLLVSAVAPAQAEHLPNEFCSESGDVCLSTKRVDGKRWLRIATAEKYFNRYELCVTGPEGSTTCHTYEIERNGDIYGDEVRWSEDFPREGPGEYTVKWKYMNGDRIGKRLGFHV